MQFNSIQFLFHFKQSNTMCTVFQIIYIINMQLVQLYKMERQTLGDIFLMKKQTVLAE